MNQRNIFFNKPLLAVLLLGFSAGLPLTLTGSTLQAWLTELNISVVTIGALSLVGLPYTLKFLWAPLLDRYGFKGLGRRRGWVCLMQFAIGVSLAVLATLHPKDQTMLVGGFALLIAFFSATQDVGIDAYRADVLQPETRGLGAAYYVYAYRIALLISGGLALLLADQFGWRATYFFMSALMFLMMLVTYFAPHIEEPAPEKNIFILMQQAFKDFFGRDKIFLLLLFIVFYKLGDALALSLITPFLLHGLSFTLTEVGLVYKTVSFVATLLGVLFGGMVLTRWPIFTALFVFGLLQAFSNLFFVLLAIVGKSYLLMSLSVFIENFCSGLTTAALLAFMMSLCHQRYTATQYAVLSALAALPRVFLGPFAGMLVAQSGWVTFFAWSFFMSLPGLIFLLMIKSEVRPYAAVFSE